MTLAEPSQPLPASLAAPQVHEETSGTVPAPLPLPGDQAITPDDAPAEERGDRFEARSLPATPLPAAAREDTPGFGGAALESSSSDHAPSAAPVSGGPTDIDDRDNAAVVVQNVGANAGTVIGIQNVSEIKRLRGTPLPHSWIAQQLRSYLDGAGTTGALDHLLEAHRVAVIHAPAGSGRYTTALHILRRRRVRDIRQVRREPNEQVDLEGLKDQDTGWILDLRDDEETIRQDFGFHLREVEAHLRATRSFVVVVTSTDTWAGIAAGVPTLGHHLVPPAAVDVLKANLGLSQPPIRELERWLAADQITQRLADATPAEAVRWAHLIGAANDLNDSSAEPKDFADLLESVVESAQNWRRSLRTWHIENTDSGHRTFLLAAAVLDGAPAESVYEAYVSLSVALRDAPHPTAGQQGPGIIELVHRIGAELGSDDLIRFRKPGYAEAVVDYFWVDRPHHVAEFTRWTADQADSLAPDLAAPLAERVTQWVIRYARTKQQLTVLRAIAAQWAGKHRDRAQDLLVAAAVDPAIGKRARDHYLAWAKAPDASDPTERRNTPVALKRALAGAFAQLAPAYPHIALRRLSELAANTADEAVADAAGDALARLWDHPVLQDTIQTTLAVWFASPQPHYASVARSTFSQLARRTTTEGLPLLLVPNDAAAIAWSVAGWRCVLEERPTPAVQAAFNTWLDAALTCPSLWPAVRDTLTEALFRSDEDRTYLAQRFLHLNHAAFSWQPALPDAKPGERTSLRDALVSALREADPTAPGTPRHATTTS